MLFVVPQSVHPSEKCDFHPPKSNLILPQEKGNYNLTNKTRILLACTLVNTPMRQTSYRHMKFSLFICTHTYTYTLPPPLTSLLPKLTITATENKKKNS